MLKRSLSVLRRGSLIVSRGNQHTPRDADWDAFLDHVVEARPQHQNIRILVLTDGGGPSADQRKRLEKALGGSVFRVAVVSDSVKVRFIVSSVALLNRDIRTFSPREMSDAFAHLNLDASEQRQAMAMLKELEPTVDPDLKF